MRQEKDRSSQAVVALHKNPKPAADYTDNTDLHGSKKFNRTIFEFVNSCHPSSSMVRFAFCPKQAVLLIQKILLQTAA
jgi:hypothetical protein